MLVTILLFLLILSLLVFVHEFGHFFVAKKMGMKVEEFGFGFPPRAWSFKKGDTIYSINWIPIGGFVRIKGESGAERHATDSFASKKGWQRFLVLFAGVFMNALTAAVILSISFMLGSPTTLDDGIPAGSTVRNVQIDFVEVVQGSPAAAAGIAAGDELISIDGQTFSDSASVRDYLHAHGDNGVTVLYSQTPGSQVERADLTSQDLKNAPGVHGIGVALEATGIVSLPFFQAIGEGFVSAWQLIVAVVVGLWELLRTLVVDHQVSADVAGPVGIARITGQVAQLGWLYVLPFVAVLSANLAVVNLLPFPALDGGRIVFLLIEKIRRKPNNERIENLVNNIGFLLLLLLVLLVTIHDIGQIGST